ncbi:hypothetical protein [Sphingomonas aerophila]|uniref:hypothetical protein n=1 Tax=Sphingomonas aerophila TaxID=1344948 RepID=UPI001FEA6093|nr:hypothetical protein [Sphingomonas aerophila]
MNFTRSARDQPADSLRNILTDPRVAYCSWCRSNETLRVNGIAEILESPDHLARFAVAGQPPKSILRITANTVFFQCSRAVIRAGL